MTNPQLGQAVKEESLDRLFLTGPAEDLVRKVLAQMALAKGNPDKEGKDTFPFLILFGPYTPGNAAQRWADYQRFDWSIPALPAINVFESGTDNKQSDNAFHEGQITIQAFWPPSMRRSDLGRVQAAFRSVIINFFASRYVGDMLDELYFVERTNKVAGLNEFGKTLTWSPNTDGLLESGEVVPVTFLDVKYRIDLRAWYRALNYQERTKEEPFNNSLSDLTIIGGEYDGVPAEDATDVQVEIDQDITVTNP